MRNNTLMCIVFAAVLPFRLKPGTHLKSKLWRYGHVPEIEQLVQVRTQQKSIAYAVRTLKCVRLDMSRFEHWERLLACDGAASLIGISHQNTERALPSRPRVRYSAPNRFWSYWPSDNEGSPTFWLSASAAWTERHSARPFAISAS